MLSRFVGTALVMFVIGGFILAGEYTGVITKVDKTDGITVKIRAKKKGEKGEEKTLKVSKDVKITKGDDKVSSEDFSEMVTKAADSKAKGVRAKITTDDDDKVTAIEVSTKGKGKAKDKKTDDKKDK